MMQAFVIVLREGFEAFLIVAITAAYLRKTGRTALLSAVNWGIAAALAISASLGFIILQTSSSQPLWEGILGLISAILVGVFVIHMWKTAPYLKQHMEKALAERTEDSASAWWGVFAFTVFMISREGFETAIMLIQVHTAGVVWGSILGALGAAFVAFLWNRIGHRINLKLFFQFTSIFLMIFVAQILVYSFHEFTETGYFPNSEYWHNLSEPYGPDGRYGQWYSIFMVAIFGAWLLQAWATSVLQARKSSA
jgi:high-affinity iron transporter